MITYEKIEKPNRDEAMAYIVKAWDTPLMIIRGKTVDLMEHEGIIARESGEIAGIAMYEVRGDTAELLLLDSAAPGRGVGTELIERIVEIAKQRGCARVVLITTNDNLDALRLYQKRGFDLVRLYHNSMDAVRRIKPNVPLTGMYGIPLRHELELERKL